MKSDSRSNKRSHAIVSKYFPLSSHHFLSKPWNSYVSARADNFTCNLDVPSDEYSTKAYSVSWPRIKSLIYRRYSLQMEVCWVQITNGTINATDQYQNACARFSCSANRNNGNDTIVGSVQDPDISNLRHSAKSEHDNQQHQLNLVFRSTENIPIASINYEPTHEFHISFHLDLVWYKIRMLPIHIRTQAYWKIPFPFAFMNYVKKQYSPKLLDCTLQQVAQNFFRISFLSWNFQIGMPWTSPTPGNSLGMHQSCKWILLLTNNILSNILYLLQHWQ